MFNERKKNNNMIGNAAYGDEFDATSHDDEEFRDLGRSQSIYQRQRRGSFHSMLVVDTLKFLNDDTDVVPKKRGEPLFADNLYKTSPPSEAHNMANNN